MGIAGSCARPKTGVLIPIGKDRFEAPAPSLFEVAEELVALGVSLHHALAVVGKVRDSSRTIAREFVRLSSTTW